MTNWWIRSDKGSHGVEEVLYVLQILLEQSEIEEVKAMKDVVVYRPGRDRIKTVMKDLQFTEFLHSNIPCIYQKT